MLKNLSLNKTNITSAFVFLKALKVSLSKKDILLSDSTLNIINRSCFLTIKVFFRHRKMAEYASNKKKQKFSSLTIVPCNFKDKKKNNFFKNRNKKIALKIKKLHRLFQFQKIYFLRQAFNNYFVVNLNKKIKFFIVKEFLKDFKKFKQNLFPRRNDLFSDFLNTSCLLVLKKIKINTYLLILAQIFTLLLKKKHGSFFFFKNFI